MRAGTLKKRLNRFFSKPSPALWLWNFTIYALILVSVVSISAEYGWIDLPFSLEEYLFFDKMVALVFLSDYLLRLFATKKRWHFFFDLMNIIDLVAILPSLVFGFGQSSGLHSVRVLKSARAIRLLRILRLFRIFRGLNPHRHHFRH